MDSDGKNERAEEEGEERGGQEEGEKDGAAAEEKTTGDSHCFCLLFSLKRKMANGVRHPLRPFASQMILRTFGARIMSAFVSLKKAKGTPAIGARIAPILRVEYKNDFDTTIPPSSGCLGVCKCVTPCGHCHSGRLEEELPQRVWIGESAEVGYRLELHVGVLQQMLCAFKLYGMNF